MAATTDAIEVSALTIAANGSCIRAPNLRGGELHAKVSATVHNVYMTTTSSKRLMHESPNTRLKGISDVPKLLRP